MSKIAVCPDPLYITKGRSYSFGMSWSDPNGVAINITGFNISAVLLWGRNRQSLTDGTQMPSNVTVNNAIMGKFTVSGTSSDTANLAMTGEAELWITIIDTVGNVQDCVYPVVGELP